MTDNVPEQEQKIAAPAAAAPTADQAASAAPAVAEAGEGATTAPADKARRNRGGRGGRSSNNGNGQRGARQRAPEAAAQAADGAPAGPSGQRTPPRTHPVLEQLAGLYPQLFGAVFRPLKRGIFQDLQAAHPELFEREALKVALGIHTRSTRYLQSVAAGDKRHDLAGQPVEAMAAEHVHHALLEVYRRRKNNKARATEDLLPKLRNRMVQAFEASGLTREAYTELVSGRDDEANALLEEAFAEWSARNARDEALLRAFEASGQTLEAFADMYGMAARAVGQTLERARRYRAVVVAAAVAAPAPAAD
ncbi:activator of osmoprotectant transporter ProP [Acidovorax sp. CF316]|uniref:ProQ/FINO family protein n=1 Tax=Acidovorax sp. CF316 TaxID=1144317 RepID=UPI00026BC687|nr:ProQ/FINO family protein [Acidovorax sp. CF316]EJE54081.1 activator of osmoprotectant transporter ProP [Acidovorax sp. CF316]